ncbi:MAG: dephospho-CoA kinase [Candidatus Magnetoovum sp. WYHC-5]|nr:dephospho-CoA kinase [Candidatus Magnetoovum sp. WYHC-5]
MLIGLTGSFGAGKSTVLEIFKDYGVLTISADRIVKELLEHQEIKQQVVSLLGNVLDDYGHLDKKKIAALVFNDGSLRARLEGILHPAVIEKIIAYHKAHQNQLVVAEIPLLFEGNYDKIVDKIVTVTSRKELVYERLSAKKGFLEEEISKRLYAQLPDEIKQRRAHFLIDNSQDINHCKKQVLAVINILYQKKYGL